MNYFYLNHQDELERWVNPNAIELKKTFGLICHRTLIHKLLTNFSVDVYLVKIVANFISGRTKKTKYKLGYSNPQPIHAGAPRGTILGPLTFLDMVNKLTSDELYCFKFVDDLSILELGEKSVSCKADRIMANLSC